MSSGHRLRTELPWHWSLEDWCTQHFGFRRQQAKADSAPWAPYEAHRPERHYEVPSVLVVLSSTAAHLQRGFISAVDLLRTSTNGFKAVLLTDMYRPPAAEVCEWPVEQVISEPLWMRHKSSNWLDYAAESVQRAQRFYGAQFILAPRNQQEARDALGHLAAVYNVLDPVLAQAEVILHRQSASPAEPPGVRWGWQSLREGHELRRHFTFGEGTAVTVEISTGRRRGLLVGERHALPPFMQRAAAQAGWAVAELSTESSRSTDVRPFFTGAARALRDALVPHGPAISVDGEQQVLPRAEGRIVAPVKDYAVIELPGHGRIRIPEKAAAEAFNRLAQVFSHQPGTRPADQSTPRLA